MRISKHDYDTARNAPRPPRFSTWAKPYFAKSKNISDYYEMAADLADFVPEKVEDRKAFDKAAMQFVVEYPNTAFKTIQNKQVQLTTPDLVTLVQKNILVFIPLLTKEQKLQYQSAGERLMRVAISLNRTKISKKTFIEVSKLHNLEKRNRSDESGIETNLYSDFMYAKYMKQVMGEMYDVEGLTAQQIWPYWLKYLESYELT